jgi:hypothetical protein
VELHESKEAFREVRKAIRERKGGGGGKREKEIIWRIPVMRSWKGILRPNFIKNRRIGIPETLYAMDIPNSTGKDGYSR